MEASLDVLLNGLMPYHSQSIVLRNIVDFIPVQHAIHRLLNIHSSKRFVKQASISSIEHLDFLHSLFLPVENRKSQ